MLMQCDGAHDIDEDALEGDNKEFFDALKKAEIIREAGFLDYLKEKQISMLDALDVTTETPKKKRRKETKKKKSQA